MAQSEEVSAQEPSDSYQEAVLKGVPFRDADGLLHYPTIRSRPQPTFTLDPFHRFMLIGSVIVAVSYAGWMIFRIPTMPEEIPMHFGPDGSVNRYGSPWEMLPMAIFSLTMILGCALLARFPRIYNYGLGKITENNIQEHYKNGVRLLAWLTFGLTLLLVISLGSIAGDWPNATIWVGLIVTIVPMIFFIARMVKL